jgi:hypothetical protein
MILTNDSNYFLIAVVLVYEVNRQDGQKEYIRHLLGRPEVSLETDPRKIKDFLTKNPSPYSLIPPHSKWLVGFGTSNIRITESMPSFEYAQNFSSIEEDPTIPRPALKGMHVYLDGVILEDGRTVGPQVQNIRQVLIDNMR